MRHPVRREGLSLEGSQHVIAGWRDEITRRQRVARRVGEKHRILCPQTSTEENILIRQKDSKDQMLLGGKVRFKVKIYSLVTLSNMDVIEEKVFKIFIN